MKGFSVIMYDHKWKKAGIAISAIGLALMFAERFRGFILFRQLDVHQHYLAFEWGMLFGFFFIVTCKEKQEDERTQTIRRKTYHMAFTLMLSVLMAFILTSITKAKAADIPVESLLMLCGMSLIFYLFMFNIGLHSDSMWEYEDQSLMGNLRSMPKNKLNILVYLAFCAIMMAFLYYINVAK